MSSRDPSGRVGAAWAFGICLIVCVALTAFFGRELIQDYQEREQAHRFQFLDRTFYLQTGRYPGERPPPASEAPGPRGIIW